MEEGSEVCLPFQYRLKKTKTARSDYNLVDTRTNQNPNNFHFTFEFRLLKCLDIGNGHREAIEEEFYLKRDWICSQLISEDQIRDWIRSQFISNEAFQSIVDQLKLSGICKNCIYGILKATVSEAILALSKSTESSSQHYQDLLSLCIYRYVSWEEGIDELSSMEVNNQVPATKESIEPLKKAKPEDGVSDSVKTCVICYENLWQETTMEVTCLPCSHLFHGSYIAEWLSRSHLCPLCRYEMPTLP